MKFKKLLTERGSRLQSSTDAMVSETILIISIVLSAFAGYYTLYRSWYYLPLFIIGILFFGLSCVGVNRILKRLEEISTKKK